MSLHLEGVLTYSNTVIKISRPFTGNSGIIPSQDIKINLPIVPQVAKRISLNSMIKKEWTNIFIGGFLGLIGIQSGQPAVVASGIAVSILYVLRNYLD